MDPILITGAKGTVGSYVDFGIRTDRTTLDIMDDAAVQAFFAQYKPKAVLHLAALVDVALCERDPSLAYRINAAGTYSIARAARKHGARMVYVSTSGVFDGTKAGPNMPSDAPNPVNVYGHSKYLGELAVQGLVEDYLIVRTSWVFGGGTEGDKKFVGKMLANRDAGEVRAVTDRSGSPTYAKDLAQALRALVEGQKRGVVHAGGGRATRFELAQEALRLVGSNTRVLEAASSDFPSAYATGENESMELGCVRPWKEALKEYIETEWKA